MPKEHSKKKSEGRLKSFSRAGAKKICIPNVLYNVPRNFATAINFSGFIANFRGKPSRVLKAEE
ncbi:MAG: hypothetical protein DBX55_07240 [Verrucomicrobia bacterium]|nr:MAG: hypothetical protein DBX55_07240 [Verrucomicrobiota bacterium]